MRIVRSKNMYEYVGDKLKNAVHCHNGIFNKAKETKENQMICQSRTKNNTTLK